MPERTGDKELELYRDLLATPTDFKEGFGWSTVVGILFCGLVMLPGSIYLGLMSGGGLGSAAQWVTVILFSEIARRSLKTLSKQNLVILLHAAGVVMAANVLFPGGPFAQMVWRGFLVGSDAVRDASMRDAFPTWFAPRPDSPAITERNLFHPDWLAPIGVMVLTIFIGFVKRYTLGYFFFRLTSDVERLPFPMAPVQAQGAMAMAEADAKDEQTPASAREFFTRSKSSSGKKGSERWRLFSLGAVLGIAFGFIQVGIPAITGVLLDQRVFLLPQPFVDTTNGLTESFLPATPTGLAIDLGILLVGMVLPFWAVMGTAFAMVLTLILNPVLHHLGVLNQWQPGMDAVNTIFANEVDFWMSFGIGAALGLLAVSLFQSVRDVRAKMRELRDRKAQAKSEGVDDLWAPRKGRGDWPLWLALGGYVATALAMIALCYVLLRSSPVIGDPRNADALRSVMIFLFVFAFLYNPLISYLNARLLGVAGQTVDIPYIKESAFILSGAKGIEVWLAPIPLENYGHQAQGFRVTELTETKFTSMIKTEAVAVPLLLVLSFVFWAFIWRGAEVPSAGFPYAQTFWELNAKRTALLFSATHIQEGQDQVRFSDTEFGKAIKPRHIGGGFISTVALFTIMSTLGLPVMFVYGVIKGLGGFPHVFIFEVLGALMARYYFHKKFGSANFLRMIPTVLAGYFTGVGLIGMFTIALELIRKAVSMSPF